jgi:hypothetical protein
VPMMTIAGLCVLFGVWNQLPLQKLIQPILGSKLDMDHSGWPHGMGLVVATGLVLAAALANHLWGTKRSGSGLGAADHIHHAPGLVTVYGWAERRVFDLYDIGLGVTGFAAKVAWGVDRAIDFLYNTVVVKLTLGLVYIVRKPHTGSHAMYLAWVLAGLVVIVLLLTWII